jgi:hypothetical protein
MESWLTGREVLPTARIAIGQGIGPELILMIQFASA